MDQSASDKARRHRDLVRRGEKIKLIKPKFQFGKYKGKTVDYVLKNDPDYIVWCWRNVSKSYHPVGLDEELYERCRAIRDKFDEMESEDDDGPVEQWARTLADE